LDGLRLEGQNLGPFVVIKSKKTNCTGKVSRFSHLIESSELNLSCFFDIIKTGKKEYLPSQ
jgi:hypothetical protein